MDEAIVQMQFSEKRASQWIKSTLALAKDHAINYKGLKPSRLVVGTFSSTPSPLLLAEFVASRVMGIERKVWTETSGY